MTSPSPPPPPPPPINDDVLHEILLRLPPLPSSLPRASLVCKQWRRVVSDPFFLRRFRAHHHRNPPLLGFFTDSPDLAGISFTPTLAPPDRIPTGRFSMHLDAGGGPCQLLSCRHGRALLLDSTRHGPRHLTRIQLLVWDPLAGEQISLPVPPAFAGEDVVFISNGAVLSAAGDDQGGHFRVAVVGTNKEHTRVFASVYSSETSNWGDLISMKVESIHVMSSPSTLVGDSLYWLVHCDNEVCILQFDLDRLSLAVVDVPCSVLFDAGDCCIRIMRSKGGDLALFILSMFSSQLWERTVDCEGCDRWMLRKSIELDKFLLLGPEVSTCIQEFDENDYDYPPILWTSILGFVEDDYAVIIQTSMGVFLVDFESMRFEKFPLSMIPTTYHPFASFYTPGI